MVGSRLSTHSLGRAGAVASRGHSVRLVTLGQVPTDPPPHTASGATYDPLGPTSFIFTALAESWARWRRWWATIHWP